MVKKKMKKVLAGLLATSVVMSMATVVYADDEPYTVTLVLKGSQQPDEERIEEKINEVLEKELNARLDLVVLPWASADQQMQLMLAGDEKN